ncbi:DUF4333 domain-containing protein [Amycolatopsis sp. cg5]|uniref:DUF4333 domain-containing protein n=1 Tax=Amycolatopsis sp. cg5 TaxID=3238802 RepID=UPI0035251701
MSTPYGGNDPQQWGQQPQHGQEPSGAYPPPPSGPQQQPGYGQDPAQQQQQWGQQPPAYGQQPGYPQQQPQQWGQPDQTQQQWAPQQQPGQTGAHDPQQWAQPGQTGAHDPSQWAQQQQQPGGAYPQSGPQQIQYGQPGQPGPYGDPGQYGQQPGFPPAPPAGAAGEKKSKKGLFIGVGAALVVIAAVLVLGFVTPGFFNTKVFDNNAMQSDVQKILTGTYKLEGVTKVTCPAEQEVKDGASFSCTATINGKDQQIPITVQGKDGNYQVGIPAK